MIKCAAIKTSDNKIYVGETHEQAMTQIKREMYGHREEGFITSNDIFVDRHVALLIAKKNNQLQEKYFDHWNLLSEYITNYA